MRNLASRFLRSFLAARSDRTKTSLLTGGWHVWLQWVVRGREDEDEVLPFSVVCRGIDATVAHVHVGGSSPKSAVESPSVSVNAENLGNAASETLQWQYWLPLERWPSGLVSVAEQWRSLKELRPAEGESPTLGVSPSRFDSDPDAGQSDDQSELDLAEAEYSELSSQTGGFSDLSEEIA